VDTKVSRKSTATIALVWGLIGASCTLGPEYHRPDVSTPSQWSPSASEASDKGLPSRSDSKSPQIDAWWAVFADPELNRLIDTAVRQNLDVGQAAIRIAAARQQRDATAGSLYPNVTGSGIAGRARMSENGVSQALAPSSATSSAASPPSTPPPSTFNLFQAGFDATWELDFFGKVRRSIQAADAEVQAAEAAHQDALISMAAEITRTYIHLRGSERQREIASEDVRTQEQLGKLLASMNKSGLAAGSDVAAQDVQVSAARASVPQAEQAVAQDRNRLALLLALPPGAVADLLESRPFPALPPNVPVGLPADLLRRRADVRGREADLQAATARIGVAKAALFPSVTLGLTGGLQSTTASQLLDWSSRFMIGGAQVSVPIFSGGKLQAQVRLANSQAQLSALAYREAVLSAFHDVDDALIAYAWAQRRAHDVQAQVDNAARSRRLSLARYEKGLSAYVEVLNAEHQFHQAELSLSDVTVETATDLVALFKALGGGWDQPSVAMR
jgi:outer membrane protein, multidrug efflux system